MTIPQFILSLVIAFIVLVAFALLLNFCRNRLRKTLHGLTGICHKTGGTVCTSCQDNIHNTKKES